MEDSGVNEIKEAVLIAALTTLITGLIEMGLRLLEDRMSKKKKKAQKKTNGAKKSDAE